MSAISHVCLIAPYSSVSVVFTRLNDIQLRPQPTSINFTAGHDVYKIYFFLIMSSLGDILYAVVSLIYSSFTRASLGH